MHIFAGDCVHGPHSTQTEAVKLSMANMLVSRTGLCSEFCGHRCMCCEFCGQRCVCQSGNTAAFWAAQYNTWLLIKLTLKGIVFSFLFFSFLLFSFLFFSFLFFRHCCTPAAATAFCWWASHCMQKGKPTQCLLTTLTRAVSGSSAEQCAWACHVHI